MIGWEFVRDAAAAVRARGLKTVVVTNGFLSLRAPPGPAYIDAFNIDLKGCTPAWYRRLGGDLDAVLSFIRRRRPSPCGAHHPRRPGENDSRRRSGRWRAG
jgi:pyruvate formate lyase activating enzyme